MALIQINKNGTWQKVWGKGSSTTTCSNCNSVCTGGCTWNCRTGCTSCVDGCKGCDTVCTNGCLALCSDMCSVTGESGVFNSCDGCRPNCSYLCKNLCEGSCRGDCVTSNDAFADLYGPTGGSYGTVGTGNATITTSTSYANIKLNPAGTWKSAKTPKINVSNTWKTISK